MSADNWAICPKCLATAKLLKQKEIEKVKDSYGKISAVKYSAMLKQSETPLLESGETLREDYAFIMSAGGIFTATYYCSCDKCSFEHSFEHENILNLEQQ